MTVAVAVPFVGGWVLGADTRSLAGYGIHRTKKIVEFDGYAIAYAGIQAACQYTCAHADTDTPEVLAHGLFSSEKDFEGNEFLWASPDRVCVVDGDGALTEYDRTVAIGGGAVAALGWLAGKQAHTVDEAESLILGAISYASTVDCSCSLPVTFVVLCR